MKAEAGGHVDRDSADVGVDLRSYAGGQIVPLESVAPDGANTKGGAVQPRESWTSGTELKGSRGSRAGPPEGLLIEKASNGLLRSKLTASENWVPGRTPRSPTTGRQHQAVDSEASSEAEKWPVLFDVEPDVAERPDTSRPGIPKALSHEQPLGLQSPAMAARAKPKERFRSPVSPCISDPVMGDVEAGWGCAPGQRRKHYVPSPEAEKPMPGRLALAAMDNELR